MSGQEVATGSCQTN